MQVRIAVLVPLVMAVALRCAVRVACAASGRVSEEAGRCPPGPSLAAKFNQVCASSQQCPAGGAFWAWLACSGGLFSRLMGIRCVHRHRRNNVVTFCQTAIREDQPPIGRNMFRKGLDSVSHSPLSCDAALASPARRLSSPGSNNNSHAQVL